MTQTTEKNETTQTASIYEQLNEMGIEMDNHQSDMYVPATPEVMAVIQAAHAEDPTIMYSTFEDLRTGDTWVDLPFQYEPHWEQKQSQREHVAPSM